MPRPRSPASDAPTQASRAKSAMNFRIALAVAAAIAVLLPAPAQTCPFPPVDDGFNVLCCQFPVTFIPQRNAVTMNAEWGVYTGCVLTNQLTAQVQIGAPSAFLC